MPEPDIDVDINDQSVSVRLNASGRSPRGRFYACISFIAMWAVLICGLLFLPGKGGTASMWHDLSQGFIVPLAILVGCSVLMVLLTWRYTVSAYPSDETFHCDRSALTISKVRWLDFTNKHWDTRYYTLASLQEMSYDRIARLRGTSIYGLRVIAEGRTQRVLPGLKPRQADKILRALKAFGVDVIDDSTLLKKLAEDSTV
jgi:hypothetical protein